ncbi:MAG: substrate-binding domain-containing protein [Spirochaetales bacterium]|nr:substrate-binding domain-containing protein [Spirochaetales bacterium]
MKSLFIFFIVVLVAAFLVSAGLSISFLVGANPALNFPQSNHIETEVSAPYLAVLLPDSREAFMRELLEGIQVQANEDHVEMEVATYGLSEGSAVANMERLTLARVAGILLLPPEDPRILKAIDQAEAHGVPVVLLDRDFPQSRRRAFVGPSPYQEGSEMARLIEKLGLNDLHVGVLLSQVDQKRQTVSSSLLVNGIAEGLGKPSLALDMDERISPPGRFAGEELVWQLFYSDPRLNVLVTTTAKDSLSALQAVTEANKLGTVNLIAVGEDHELKKALRQGILKGLILRDPVGWGKTAVKTLVAIIHGESVSSYISLPVKGYTSGDDLP